MNITGWSPEDIPQTTFGKQMRYGVDVYYFARTLATKRYRLTGSNKDLQVDERPEPNEWCAYEATLEELYAGFKHWMKDDEGRSPGHKFICQTEFIDRLEGIMEDLISGGLANTPKPDKREIRPAVIKQYFDDRKEELDLLKTIDPEPLCDFDASFHHCNTNSGEDEMEE